MQKEMECAKWAKWATKNPHTHLEVLVDLAAQFIHSSFEEMAPLIHRALGQIAQVMQADRAYVVEFHRRKGTQTLTQEWCAEGVSPSIHLVQDAPFEEYSDFVPALLKGEIVEIQVKNLAPESATRSVLLSQSVRSLLVAPLHEDGVVQGAVGLDYCMQEHCFDDDDRLLLRGFGHLLAGVLRKRIATQALLERERQQQLLLNNSPSMIYQLSPEGIVMDCSGSVTSLLGWQVADVIGRDSRDFAFPADLPIFEEQLRHTVREKKISAPRKFRILSSNGEPRWFRTVLAPVYDKGGQLLHFVGNSSDVTELQAMAEEIERFSLLTRWTSNPVIFTDNQRKIIWVNPAFEAVSGYSLEEVQGKSPSLQHGANTNVACRKRMREALNRAERFIEEVLHYHRDGHPYWVKLEVIPHRDAEGKLKGFVSVQTDITQIRQREEELRALHTVIEQSPTIVYITDLNLKITYANPAFERLTGYSQQETLGQSAGFLRSGLTAPAIYEEMWEHLNNDLPWSGALQNQRKNGELYCEFATIAPVFDAERRKTGYIAVKQDISVLHNLQKELQMAQAKAEEALAESVRANRAKDEFLATMSHEVRTPLNAVLGLSKVLAETPLDAKQKRYLTLLRKNSKLLLTIVNDILDFSKIESGKLELLCETFCLEQMVTDFSENLGLRVREKGLCYTADISPDLPSWVLGDEGRLLQILHNLGSNALKFTLQGSIHFSVQVLEEGCVRFAVRDTGIGIPEEKRPFLFQRFEQLDSGITRQFGGTGLGLAICKQLVTLMGGDIGVESEKGNGSEFWFTVSLSNVERSRDVSAAIRAPEVKLKGRLLVVEDYESNRIVLEELLSHLHLTCTFATNGQEALEILSTENFDLVLMDIQMPGMDGREAARRIRGGEAGARNKEIPIVALTAHVQERERRLCEEVGMVDYLTKPISIHDLANCLQRWIPSPASDGKLPQLAKLENRGARDIVEEELCFDPEALCVALGGRKDFVVRYLKSYQEIADRDLCVLRQSVEDKNWQGVRQCIHNMGGACGYFHSPDLDAAMQNLHAAACKGQEDAAQSALADFEKKMSRFLIQAARKFIYCLIAAWWM